MSTFVKKILVSALAVTVLATVAMPPTAQAQTAAELQVQINALLAQIAALQAQLAGATGGGGIAGIPAGFTFTQNLGQGSSGVDVTHVQHLLNSNPATQVASSGAGSPGQETQFFGPLTAAAVSQFQNIYASEILAPLGLTSGTGFFGASSRAKANKLVAVAPAPAPTPTPTPTPGTPAPSPTPGISTPGVEGSLIVTIASSPASGAILNIGETEAVTGVDVKATGSDVLVSRLDVEFDTRPYLYISEMTVSDGTTSKTIAVTQSNSTEVTVGTKYSVRVDGLSILVPKDTTKKFTVTVKAVSGLPVGTTTKDLVLTFIANAVRGTDGAGLTQTGPTASLATRTITVQEPTTADLELTAHADNPKARPIMVSDTAETNGVTLAIFNLKAKNNDAILRNFVFTDAGAGSSTLNVVYLYDGSTLLSSTSSLGTASSTLADINLTVPKDTTKILTLKADLKKADGNFETSGGSVASSTITIEANKHSIDAEDATSFAVATVSGSTVSPGSARFYQKAPVLALATTTVSPLTAPSGSATPQQAEVRVRVNVTATGGDIYIPKFSTTNASSGMVASVSVTASGPALTGQTITSNATEDSSLDAWVVRASETKYIEYSGVMDNDNDSADETFDPASYFTKLVDVKWGTTLADAQQPANTREWGMEDFKSSSIFIQDNSGL